MQLCLPKELLVWIDDNRGVLSRQAFIISTLIKLKDYPKNFNTKGLIDGLYTKQTTSSYNTKN